MSIDKSVKLCPSGGSDYWIARYYDSRGRRRRVIIGRKDELSKRAAGQKCGELAERLAREPGRRDMGEPRKLGLFLDEYLKLRGELKPASMVWQKLVVARLKEHFGENTHMDKITRARAAEFQAWVATLTKPGKEKKKLSPHTVKTYVVVAREIFGYAVRLDATPRNPFDKLRIVSAEHEKEWVYITHEQTEQIIEAAPSQGWRCLIALARWAGLRRGEALRLTWGDVDWDDKTITVRPPGGRKDTKNRRRVVPIQPRLHLVLRAAFEAAPEGAKLVCDVSPNSMEARVRAMVRRAKLPPLEDKPLHTLRKNLETDWLAEYPVLDVTGWLGNSPEVARKHYNKTKAETVAKVTGGKSEAEQLRARIAELEAKLKTQEAKA